MSDKVYEFPSDFTWGTATSAYQIEGGNYNTDWWLWENSKENRGKIEPCGIACDSYNRYEEDFDLCVKNYNNAVRISIEWARLEPEEGKFSKREFDHYRNVLQAAKDRNLKTFVTLHHFTNPIWFSKKGGWHGLKASTYFARYAERCAVELGDLCDVILTINEPQVLALMAYVRGEWPPNKKSLFLSLVVQINFMLAHSKAYTAIKLVKDVEVGLVKHMVWYEPSPLSHFFLDKIVARFIYWLNDGFFIEPIRHKIDVLGLNYYFTNRFKNLKIKNPDAYVSDLNWWINPEGLQNILLDLKKYGLPIYITENGIADAHDRVRPDIIREMLIACARAMEKEAPLKGYFHWSLIDNYEWNKGYWPRFGLVNIDRSHNLKRIPRKSFYYYGNICKTGKVS
ncbi:hypothetical protein A3K42_00040 [candidate division WWE3 bacterium RBG_13_37_7]|uniref:Beta-glucosidase n=1 Tax=candidate division WWE3 bacterium RBG_13_37_7 TaxID=1802609 RepID=A0A1F4U238_UNCKA|nr:MAG: hypothetical protein A3K42_00040 [candidate division WWE3 bacterium RBG_13_37_7]